MRAKLCYDIAAVLIMIVVLVYHLRRNQAKNNRNSLFFILAVVSLFCCFSEIVHSSLIIAGIDNQKLLMLVEALCELSLTIIPPCYVFYMIIFMGNEQKFLEHKRACLTVLAPEALWLATLLIYYFVSFIVGNISVSGGFEPVRNAISLALAFFYSVLGLIYIYHFRKAVSGNHFWVLSIPIILTILAFAAKFFIYPYQSVLFVVAMCFLLLLLLNRASTGLIDTDTGFRTQVAFADEVTLAAQIHLDMKLVLIRIINYKKAVNMYGYEDTLQMIIRVSKRITKIMSENKIDGECFYDEDGSFIISVFKKSFDRIHDFADEIAKEVMSDALREMADFAMSANVCIVSFPEDAEDVDTVLMLLNDLDNMEHSLHAFMAKDITSKEDFKIRKQMNRIIDRALENGYFSVYYQPIYCLKKKAFLSAEALIRLKDPEYGFISPAVFIPIAEKTGAIHKIGTFVSEEVSKFIGSKEFKDLGVEYIEVNLSAAQCLRADIIDEIGGLSKKYGVSPKQINLEITETAECYSQNRLLQNVRSLHNDGYSFSLDDFGTGYSNLLRMAAIPLSIIKLDRAFVLMDENDKFHAIIKNMVHLFKQMGLKILVEGIETQEMVEKFTDIDVDYIQGFYFSKPLPKDEYIKFLKSHSV